MAGRAKEIEEYGRFGCTNGTGRPRGSADVITVRMFGIQTSEEKSMNGIRKRPFNFIFLMSAWIRCSGQVGGGVTLLPGCESWLRGFRVTA